MSSMLAVPTRGERIERARGSGRARHSNLFLMMEEPRHARGREEKGSASFAPSTVVVRSILLDVLELARQQLVIFERLVLRFSVHSSSAPPSM